MCINITQPSLETLASIAKVLEVDISELLNRTKGNYSQLLQNNFLNSHSVPRHYLNEVNSFWSTA